MKKPKKLEKLPIYDLEKITTAGRIDQLGFEQWSEGGQINVGFAEKFHRNYTELMHNFNDEWTELCGDDESELTEWESRMRLVQGMLDEIERQVIAGKTKPRLVDWPKIIEHIGFLNAFRVVVEQVIAFNNDEARSAQGQAA